MKKEIKGKPAEITVLTPREVMEEMLKKKKERIGKEEEQSWAEWYAHKSNKEKCVEAQEREEERKEEEKQTANQKAIQILEEMKIKDVDSDSAWFGQPEKVEGYNQAIEEAISKIKK